MEVLEKNLKELGIVLDPAAAAMEVDRMVKMINSECNKFCAETDATIKAMYFV